MPTKLSILVFVASPLDYARYRHASLYLEFEHAHETEAKKANLKPGDSNTNTEDDIKSSVMEVVGSPGYFSFYERVNTSPVAATGLAKSVYVASIPDSVPVSSLRATISGTPVADQGDWNSQNWVGDALGRLVTAGYMDAEDKDRGLDDMVDVILEAKDEEIA
ncbi:uncharacterized protein N7496_004852 [Penicillium cataractarum]|uniref:Uncharacterized protein n=1 Tax=Penicillium cataractarum TaxID=2100454 RepID=A0A9W9SJG6_9EURO|nr:uncharacterized protein N7496_004852 [Penicillium cataractarum]KAJ5377443.1 hypothetical protein N7496_004852 [Penicillium cataractarum]